MSSRSRTCAVPAVAQLQVGARSPVAHAPCAHVPTRTGAAGLPGPARSGARPRRRRRAAPRCSAVVLATSTTDDAGTGLLQRAARHPAPRPCRAACAPCCPESVTGWSPTAVSWSMSPAPRLPDGRAAAPDAAGATSRRVTAPSSAATPRTAPLRATTALPPSPSSTSGVSVADPQPRPGRRSPRTQTLPSASTTRHRPGRHRRRARPGVATCVVAVTEAGSTTETWPDSTSRTSPASWRTSNDVPSRHQAAVELLDLARCTARAGSGWWPSARRAPSLRSRRASGKPWLTKREHGDEHGDGDHRGGGRGLRAQPGEPHGAHPCAGRRRRAAVGAHDRDLDADLVRRAVGRAP